MSGSNCCFLTCVQVFQGTGKEVWYSHIFKTFPQFVVIHTVDCHKEDFSIVNEAEVDVFLFGERGVLFAFSVIQWMLAIWSLVPLPFLNPACTPGSSWFTYCRSLACKWMQLGGSLNIFWHCPSLGLGWKLNFSSTVATAELSKFADILSAAR